MKRRLGNRNEVEDDGDLSWVLNEVPWQLCEMNDGAREVQVKRFKESSEWEDFARETGRNKREGKRSLGKYNS